MRTLNRIGLLFAVMALLLLGAPGLVTPAHAAGVTDCFGLNSADCSLLMDALNPSSLTQLAAFNLNYDLDVKLASAQKDSNLELTSKGSGPFSIDAETIIGLAKGDAATVLKKLLMDITSSASYSSADTTASGNFEVRVVDDVLYFKGDQLTGNQWKSFDLSTLPKVAAKQSGLGDVVRGARALISLNRLSSRAGVVSAARGADRQLDGQTIADFTYTIDLGKLLAAPEFTELVKFGIESAGEKVNDKDLKELTTVLTAYLKNVTLVLNFLVGTDDHLLHGVEIDLNGTFDPSVVAPLAGGGSPQGNDAQPLNLDFHFSVMMNEIGRKVDVTAPADATPLDLSAVASPTPTP